MTSQPRKGIRLAEFLDQIKSRLIFVAFALIGLIGAVVGFFELVPVDRQLSYLAGFVVFLGVEIWVLFEIVSKSTDDLHTLANRPEYCRLIAGPRNAKLRLNESNWVGEGITWLGLVSTSGSSLDLSLIQPQGVGIEWKYRDGAAHIWKRIGPDAQGTVTWTLTIPGSTELETLGHFELSATSDPDGLSVQVKAFGKGPNGTAIADSLSIQLWPDIAVSNMKHISLDEEPSKE